MMVRGYLPAPRPKDIIYAPIDLAVAIGEGLTKRGHTVDFYGPLGTELNTNIVTRNLRPLVHNQSEIAALFTDIARMSHYVPDLWDRYLATEMFKRAQNGEYDLLHFHHPEIALPMAVEHQDIAVVHTLHDPVYPWYKELFELYQSPNQQYISISNNQRRDAPDLPYISTVYNGVDLQQFPFGEEPEDYLLVAGRIVPEKGFKEAIQVAQQTNNRLLIIGPTYSDSQDYFDQYIKPHLSDQILYLGYVEHDQMWRYFQKAKAFLTPVQWEEPFGLTTIEAMACGTPVISLKRGAAPELIINKKTGYVVDSIAEMVSAVDKIDRIKRQDCRSHVQAKFSIDTMVDKYEKAFIDAFKQHRKNQSPAQRGKALTKKIRRASTKLKTTAGKRPLASTLVEEIAAEGAALQRGFKEIVQEISKTIPGSEED